MKSGLACGLLLVISATAQVSQTIDARPLAGKPVYITASIRHGQLWMRVTRRGHTPGLFDNDADKPIPSASWTVSEVRLIVPADAEAVEFGVTGLDGSAREVRSLAVETDTEDGERQLLMPANLDFAADERGAAPSYWSASAEVLLNGCRVERPCARVPPAVAASQSWSAALYRGKVLRADAWVKGDQAQLWLRTDHPSPGSSAAALREKTFVNVSGGEWRRMSLTREVEPDATAIAVGITPSEKSAAWIEGLTVEVVSKPDRVPSQQLKEDSKEESALPALPSSRALPALATLPDALLPVLTPAELAEKRALVQLAATHAASYQAGLPDFLCTQVIRRAEDRSHKGWRQRDVLTVQIGYADRSEHYKLLMIDNRRTSESFTRVGGAISAGEYGSLLREIFRPHIAQFHWQARTSVEGRAAEIFSYQIPQSQSGFQITYSPPGRRKSSMIVAYHGAVYLDAVTGETLRIVRIADLPADFPIRRAYTELEYGTRAVAGSPYLLPVRAQLDLDTPEVRTQNRIEFQDYRKFAAHAQVTYEP